MSAQNTHEGQYIARLMLAQLGSTEHPDNNESARTIHSALLELIDVPLSWNNLEATVERLDGFAQGLADGLAFRIPPEPPSEDLDHPQGAPCIASEGGPSNAQ